MTSAALGAGDEVVDLIDEGAQKGLVLWLEVVREGRECDFSWFSDCKSRLPNEFFALFSDMGELGDLLIHIDINIKKSRRILVNDALLLAIKEVEETTILLKLVLQCDYDLFEFLLDVHKFFKLRFFEKLGLEEGGNAVWTTADGLGNSICKEVIVGSRFIGTGGVLIHHWLQSFFEHATPEDRLKLFTGVGNFCILW